MDVARIVIRRDKNMGHGWDVECDGLIATHLTFEEVLGQIATLIHPEIQRPRFAMYTVDDEMERDRKSHGKTGTAPDA